MEPFCQTFIRLSYLLTLLLLAQEGYSQKLIPRIGISLARTSKSAVDSEFHYKTEKLHPGISLGLGYEFQLNESISFYTEIGYIKKGQKSSWVSKVPTIHYVYNANYSLDFLEAPILFKAKIDKSRIKFFPLWGISLAYGLGGKMDYYFAHSDSKGGIISYTRNLDVSFSQNNLHTQDGNVHVGKAFDIGIQAGIGVEVFKKILVDLRYTYGLLGFEYFANESDKNRVLQFSVSTPITL